MNNRTIISIEKTSFNYRKKKKIIKQWLYTHKINKQKFDKRLKREVGVEMKRGRKKKKKKFALTLRAASNIHVTHVASASFFSFAFVPKYNTCIYTYICMYRASKPSTDKLRSWYSYIVTQEKKNIKRKETNKLNREFPVRW